MSRAMLAREAEVNPRSRTSAPARAASEGLRIGPANDAFEQEADRAANQIVSGTARKVAWSLSTVSMTTPMQRQCTCGGTCDECKKKKWMQREATGRSTPMLAPPAVHDVLRRPGRAMDPDTRDFMESRFGYDFSNVRIFHDDVAASSATVVSANAYTVGEKIVFNHGRYAPGSQSGRRLLAHELAHVVQQEGKAGSLIQRDNEEPETDVEKQNNSVLAQAFRAADAKRWEVAARLANGLSPYELRVFLSQYKSPDLITQLHLGAVNAEGVGPQSAVAIATEATYKETKHKDEVRYRKQLAAQNGTPPPPEDGAATEPAEAPKPLTVQEKKQRCESGETKGLMVFPLRLPRGLWRISVAPIMAERSGNEIVVHQPVNAVLGDSMFKREVKTLPLNTFLGGVHLAPDDIVRVRLYDDNERVICVSGEQMLNLSKATDTAVLLSMLGTVLDAATVVAPGLSQGLSRGASMALGGVTVAANEGLEVARQESAVHYGLQDHIEWASIAFDTLLQAVTLGFGGKLTEAAVERVAAVAGGAYTRPALRLAVEAAVQGSVAVLQTAAKQLFARLRSENRQMTVGDFLEQLAWDFGQGALFHLITSTATPAEPNVHPSQESGTASHGTATHAAASPTHGEPAVKSQTHAEPHAPEHLPQKPHTAPHEGAANNNIKPETATSPKAFRKEEALATREVIDPEATEQHEVIATKDGVGRCSSSPCPAISAIYAKDLAENPEFKARYDHMREVGATDSQAAAAEGATLVRDIEITRRNAKRMPKTGQQAPTNPDRSTTRKQWTKMESERRSWNRAIDNFGESFEAEASTSKVKDGPKSGYTIDNTRVPGKRRSHIDIDADPKGPDARLPVREGETSRQAVVRVESIIGKQISEIPELAKLWNEAKASVLSRHTLTESNYESLYDSTRNAFWKRVGGKTPEAKAARALLENAGFSVDTGKSTAPKLADTDPSLSRAETTVSLDHLQEKALDDNWKKALDADNLQFEFAMPNTDRENRQARHPELRPGAAMATTAP